MRQSTDLRAGPHACAPDPDAALHYEAIDDETYRALEQELDLSEVSVTRRESLYLKEG